MGLCLTIGFSSPKKWKIVKHDVRLLDLEKLEIFKKTLKIHPFCVWPSPQGKFLTPTWGSNIWSGHLGAPGPNFPMPSKKKANKSLTWFNDVEWHINIKPCSISVD